jgi:hypothetical protein
MVHIAIKTYVDMEGLGVVEAWLGKESAKAAAKFDERVSALSDSRNWGGKRTTSLSGKPCLGLVEIRLCVDNVQHRPIGFFGPNSGEFTILLFAKEVGGAFVPKSACEICQTRKREVIDDEGRSRYYDL